MSVLPFKPKPQADADAPTAVITIRRGENTGRREWAERGQRWLRRASPFLLLAFWELLARIGVLDERFFPPPSEIALSAVQSIADGSLLAACVASLERMVIGYGVGAIAGIAVGLWLGLSAWFRALLEPWIQLTYPVPKLAIYPLIVLIVGLGEVPIIALLAIAVFYIVAINTIAGVLAIRKVILDVGRDCNASFAQSFLTIALPASMPHIFTSLEIALGIAFVVLIAAEFISAKTGLGAIIWSSWQLFDVAPMYVAIVVVSGFGYFSVIATRFCGDLLMPWRKGR
jgi:NitT/TauT family transport system permease protein